MPRFAPAALAILALTGCGSSIAGDWSGTIECEDPDLGTIEFDVDLELESTGGGLYEGEMSMTGDFAYGGVDFTWDQVFEVEVEQPEGSGEQDLEIVGSDCKEAAITMNDEPADFSCDDVEDAEGELGTWDGADTIVIEDDGCEGEIER